MSLSKVILSEHAAVATEHPLASMAAYDVLRSGGNAFDAATTASLVLAVTFHPAGGLGGDFFAMLYEAKSGKVHCLNSSGWSTTGLTMDLVTSGGRKIPKFGPLTVTVPGLVAGVWEMQRKFGTTEFGKLLSPSIEYSKRGFPAGPALCRSTAAAFSELPEEGRRIFAPDGKPPAPGVWIKQEKLGMVIEEVALRGPSGFYSDWPADEIMEALGTLGVPCDPSDFDGFSPEWVEPLELDYKGTKIYEVPPNSMGATSLLMLKLLLGAGLEKMGPLSRERIVQTFRAALTAYASRDKLLGDPRFSKIDLDGFMATPADEAVPPALLNPGDTTAFSIVDPDGNLVSGIQSLFNHFGSRVFVPGTGMFLSNRGAGFNLSGPNKVEPRKRPLNTLSSMILERDGRPVLGIGTSGGDYRPMQHTLFVTNAVDYGMPAEKNVGFPRFLWGGGHSLLAEEGYEIPGVGDFELERLPMPGRTGVCQAVELGEGYRKAVCDVRGDGVPAGY